ncbi:MAG: hypothetical protein AAFO28_03540 [Pseudomonadota bacterium]
MFAKSGKSLAKFLLGAVAALGCSAAVQAETLTVEGTYAASVDLPGDIDVIAVDRIAGRLGPDAQVAIMQTLGSVAVDGGRYFRVVQGNSAFAGGTVFLGNQPGVVTRGASNVDAVLTGTLRADVFEQRSGWRTRRQCVARDRDGDCIRREEIRIPCFQLSVELQPRLALTSVDGRLLYANNQPLIEVVRYCRDDFFIPSELEIAGLLIDQLAQAVRLDLAPETRVEGIRVMEMRKGLEGADRKAFKDAIRLTKNDAYGACLAFEDLEARNPAHVSVLFNIGLCREAEGDLVTAQGYYAQALRADPGRDYPELGLGRIASRERAAFQLAARQSRYAASSAQ